MTRIGLKRSAALVGAAFVAIALAGPAAAMGTADEREAAAASHDFGQRLAELERRVEVIGERIDDAAPPPRIAGKARPFVETYFEELDRYGD